ncbi:MULTISPECIES: BppU family phage baseplate upper protein [Bacillus cereus group]|uniref:BppU N-terminal domain-containing protein n=1 Tax=Bacillus thuringiensis TaxID=1428 RepID=A0A9X6QCF0_BACTU|nr:MULTISPECIES: BppU family phage baseplate upper protein [Bacillus cereus group]MEB8985458.1 BppU family phage baseplate upper protein [Bacillus cereus]MEB9459066.1 BppU family phage baseplate upper protein [Bacillus cereus]MEC0044095.1 BppU family phage baseplate upper protein [Bacillus cereus]MEC2486966.1 BppU family phage baseplate upper protein [Bacillus cereus]MEC2515972.1 BppU family phage baseplate upper protein [Bacillus cereus]
MRNEEIMIDLADPVFTKTIRSRQNDKNGLKLTVYVREKGEKVDLTGYVVKYEATNHTGVFIRDDAQIVDAKNGVFSYSFTSQAVSTSDDWTAYFVMEKNTERMSTPDIRIALRRDVKEGNIKIENYISDFEVLKKTIDALQQAVDKMDVVKRSGGMMTGYLTMRPTLGSNIGVGFNSEDKLLDTGLVGVSDGQLYLKDWKNNKVLFEKSPTGTFNVFADNLLKKAGDIINGLLEFKSDNAIVLGSRSFKSVIHKGAQGELIFAPSTKEQGDTWDWSKRVEFRTDGTIRQANDTGWINLPTTGVENIPDRILKYKRSGEQISVIGSVKYLANTTVFATLPAGFRPVQNIAFPALAYGNGPTACEVTVKSDGGIFLNGVQNGNVIHIAMSFLI